MACVCQMACEITYQQFKTRPKSDSREYSSNTQLTASKYREIQSTHPTLHSELLLHMHIPPADVDNHNIWVRLRILRIYVASLTDVHHSEPPTTRHSNVHRCLHRLPCTDTTGASSDMPATARWQCRRSCGR